MLQNWNRKKKSGQYSGGDNYNNNFIRDAPTPIPGIGIGWIGAKKGVSVSVVEHEYWYR